jgi:predicted dehydrogenase
MTTRREFVQTVASFGALAALGPGVFGAPSRGPRHRGRMSKLQLLQVGVGGTIAPADRSELEGHPGVVFTGLCDVDRDALAEVAKDRPQAFTCADFREAFDRFGDRFDGVVVCTPDHNHAVVDLWALRAKKHVYGQKPLVQQLEEVAAIEAALAARPDLVTQVGNQRMGGPGRQHAVDILRRGLLGRAIEAHVWISGPSDEGDGYFYYGGLKDPSQPPASLDWPLWLGAAEDAPFREGLAPVRWRSSWDYGTGQLGDWCTHLLDVLVFAYDLASPVAVQSHTRTPSDFYHAQHVASTLVYPGSTREGDAGRRFARPEFVVRYCDKSQAPSRAALGLPPGRFPSIGTLVVCEEGVLLVRPEGEIEAWRGGKQIDWAEIPGAKDAKITARNHWHSWVDRILGAQDAFVQTPFAAGASMAEAGLLCAKAARFPGVELRWDKSALAFSNHEEASKTIVRRTYRPGFELPRFG